MRDDLLTLWAPRDTTDGRLFPYHDGRFPFTRAATRDALPIYRSERFFGVIGGRWYEPQDFPNEDMRWDNPTPDEYEKTMAPYRAQRRQERVEAVLRTPLEVLAVVLAVVLLPFAIVAKIMRWAYR